MKPSPLPQEVLEFARAAGKWWRDGEITATEWGRLTFEVFANALQREPTPDEYAALRAAAAERSAP